MMYDPELNRPIQVIFPKNPSGNVEDQLAQSILKQCKYLRQSASKLFNTFGRDDDATVFLCRQNVLKQYTKTIRKYTSLSQLVEKTYMNTTDIIRKDLVIATLPALGWPEGVSPNPWQIQDDLSQGLVRQAKWLRNGRNARTIPDKKDWQYWQRMADSVEAFRVEVQSDRYRFDPTDIVDVKLTARGRKTPWVEYPFALV